MKETVIEFFRSLPGFKPGKKVLCALSGGGDSVALLVLLNQVQSTLQINVGAAHFNHCLRDTANRDEEYAKTLCESLCVPFFAGKGDVAAAAGGKGVEEKARDMRYEFLRKVAAEEGYDYIATAHTADDNLETLILNLIRGSGTRGLAGIPPVRGNIVRPLLSMTGLQLREYLKSRSISYMDDETNFRDICARNIIRHRIVPELRKLNTKAVENAANAAALLRRDEAYLQECAAKWIDEFVTEGKDERIEVDAKKLAALPEAISGRVIKTLCPECAGVHIKSVLELCKGPNPSGSVSVPGRIAAREYGRLVMEKPSNDVKIDRVTLAPGITKLGNTEIILESGKKVYSSETTFYLNDSNIRGELQARSRRPGDRIKLPGRPEKSLKKWMIDEKIPRKERDGLLVVEDEEGIVLVEGLGVAQRCAGEDITLTIRRN